jgi:hypothetical protein
VRLCYTFPLPSRARLVSLAMPSPSPSSSTTSTSSASLVPPLDAAADTADRRVALDVELFAQRARGLTLARETRPKNTNKAYGPKQREWRVSL